MADFEETQNQNAASDELKFAIPEKGYGVYLKGILPPDQRVLAGAFSVSMQQIKNIDQVQIEKFAQAAYSNENMFGLNLVNGTDVPTDVRLARISQDICAVGGGVYGTYTMSNFFGAMSSLPYPLREIYEGIKELETQTLKTIYQNLYLITTWEQASATWDGASFDYTSRGGGYGRGTGAPNVTVNGNPASAIIGTDPNDLVTFGKIIDISYTGPAGVVSIDPPPGPNPVSNNADYNDLIQQYIDDSNNEIFAIGNANANNFEKANILNTNWNITGKALKQEQRARYISSGPVPIPYDRWIATYPTSQYIFVDAIPALAGNTLPHMYAQTLEHISDLDLVGGQSVIGLMRESRNQERLADAGLELDNNLAVELNDQNLTQLILNNTLPGAIDGINGYTIPVFPGEGPNTTPIIPDSYYDPCLPGVVSYITENPYVTNTAVAAILSAPPIEPDVPIESLPISPTGYEPVTIDPVEIIPTGTDTVTPDTSYPCTGDVVETIYGTQPAPIATPLVGTGGGKPVVPVSDYPLGVNQPVKIIPPTLDRNLTASTLFPSTPTVAQAIDQVIKCNCDCWVA